MVLLTQEAGTGHTEIRRHTLGRRSQRGAPPSGAFEVASSGEATACRSQHSVKFYYKPCIQSAL